MTRFAFYRSHSTSVPAKRHRTGPTSETHRKNQELLVCRKGNVTTQSCSGSSKANCSWLTMIARVKNDDAKVIQNLNSQQHAWTHKKSGKSWMQKNKGILYTKKNRWYPQQPQRFIFQIFLKRAAKPSAGNSVLTWPCAKDSQNLLRDLFCNLLGTPLNLTWLCAKASWNLLPNLLRNPVEPDLALHRSLPDRNLLRNLLRNPNLALYQSLPHLLRKLLQNPVEPDLALHQSLTFSQTLLNLTWLCTKASGTLLKLDLPEPCWTWPHFPPKPPRPSPEPSPEPLRNPVEPDLTLHQSFPESSLESSPEPSWTWPGSAPKPPEPCWTWPGSAPKPPRPSPEPSSEPCWTWPALHQKKLPRTFSGTFKASQTFSATFSGTLLNLTWLCTKASQTFWTWPGSAPTKPAKPSPEPPDLARLCTKASQTVSKTFSGTLLNLTWQRTKASPTFSGTFCGTFSGTFSGTLLNVTWLCTKASQTFSGTFGTFSGISLNLTQHLHQCTPELFWAEDPISLRC